MLLNRIKCAAKMDAGETPVIGAALPGFLAPTNLWHNGTPVDGVTYIEGSTFPFLVEHTSGAWKLGVMHVGWDGGGIPAYYASSVAAIPALADVVFSMVSTAAASWATGIVTGDVGPEAMTGAMAAGVSARATGDLGCIAIGTWSASGGRSAIAIGLYANTAKGLAGESSIAIGKNAGANAFRAIAIGESAYSNIEKMVAIGKNYASFNSVWHSGAVEAGLFVTRGENYVPGYGTCYGGSMLKIKASVVAYDDSVGENSAYLSIHDVEYYLWVKEDNSVEVLDSTFTIVFAGVSALTITFSIGTDGELNIATAAPNARVQAHTIVTALCGEIEFPDEQAPL